MTVTTLEEILSELRLTRMAAERQNALTEALIGHVLDIKRGRYMVRQDVEDPKAD